MEKEALLFNEGVRSRYYLNSANNRGWSVVYMLVQVGDKRLRISTMIKVKTAYWSKGNIIVPLNASMSERYLHKQVNEKLNNINNSVDSLIYSYLCETSEVNTEYLLEEITNVIKRNRMEKRTTPKRITALFKGLVMELDNPKSQSSLIGMVNNFERFLNEAEIKDSIESLNMSTMRKYRDWLNDSGLTAVRGTQCLSYVFTLVTKLERKFGYDFKLNKNQIEPIVDRRTLEEKQKNAIALTHEEIDSLLALNLEGYKEVVRDLFVLQCYCGVRHEDLGLLLSKENIVKQGDTLFSVFITQKRKTKAHIPLNTLYPKAIELLTKHFGTKVSDKGTYLNKYNKTLKEIAREANLNRIIEQADTIRGKVEKVSKPIYECITSHAGRHTFITNCQRYFGLQPKQIAFMSAHADSTMIEKVYTNVETKDTLAMLSNLGNNKPTSPNKAVGELKPTRSNNYSIDGIAEAQSVLKYLSVEYCGCSTLEDYISLIEGAQNELLDYSGVSIEVLKSIFNLTLPLSKRIQCLSALVKTLSIGNGG